MSKNNLLKRITKKNTEVTKYDFIICPNCGHEEVGKYCPNCGQSNKDFNKPLKEIGGDLLDSINLDIRLVNTLVPFLFKPGFLTQEYFKGRRKRYVPPMRMYILFSVLFFFLAQLTDLNAFRTSVKVNEGNIADSVKQEKNKALIGSESANYMTGANALTIDSALQQEQGIFDNLKIVKPNKKDTNDVKTFKDLDEQQKEQIIQAFESDTTESDGIKEGVKDLMKGSDKINTVYAKFLKNSSYVLFLLMPFFALLLAMILWRSKKMYVHHLIFSINFHTFIFALSSIIIILTKILPESISQNLSYLGWLYPIYLMFGIKRFYNRSYIGAFFKAVGISLLYLLVIFTVMIIIIVVTAKEFYDI